MGNRVLPKARQMLTVADQLREIAQGKSDMTANFRLACFRSIGTYVLPTIFEALSVDYPGIRVDVDDSADGFTAAIIQSVREGRADIGIARRTEVSDLTRIPYIYDIYCAAVPESLAVAAPVRWDQLASLPYIQPHNVDGASTVEACRAAGFPSEPARRMTNDIAILAMVSRGAGVTILPRLAAYPVPRGAKIASLPIVLKRELALYVRPEVARTRAMRTLCRYLRDKALVRQAECFRSGDVGFDY
jgi:DNA-binding transcriptional LysR family regulator